MIPSARQWLGEQHLAVDLVLADDPGRLVLRGAASLVSDRAGVALDCGSTTVKRALVAGGGGGDEGHRMLERPPVPTPQGSGDEVVAALADAAAGPVSELPDPGGGLDLSVALATYVDETGQPYAGQLGPYATLGDVDLVGDLAARLGAVLDRAVAVRVTHDGASALLGALTTDPAVDAAIVLGTSIGSGLR